MALEWTTLTAPTTFCAEHSFSIDLGLQLAFPLETLQVPEKLLKDVAMGRNCDLDQYKIAFLHIC